MRAQRIERRVWLELLPALGVAVATIVVAGAASYAPPPKGEMAIVFSPGTSAVSAYRAVLAAQGRFVAPTMFDNVVIAYADDAGFSERVRAQGGLFALAAKGLCGSLAAPGGAT